MPLPSCEESLCWLRNTPTRSILFQQPAGRSGFPLRIALLFCAPLAHAAQGAAVVVVLRERILRRQFPVLASAFARLSSHRQRRRSDGRVAVLRSVNTQRSPRDTWRLDGLWLAEGADEAFLGDVGDQDFVLEETRSCQPEAARG